MQSFTDKCVQLLLKVHPEAVGIVIMAIVFMCSYVNIHKSFDGF